MRIKEFAQQIGVSPTTVSQAINGTGRVSPATREMVLKRMSELGYVPNPHAQQLVTGRSHMVALHHGNTNDGASLSLTELTHALQLALRNRGYGLLLDTASSASGQPHPLTRWIAAKAIDGVIVIKDNGEIPEWAAKAASAGTPVVTYGLPSITDPPRAANVWSDDEAAFQEAVDYLAKRGHNTVGYIGAPDDPMVDTLRRCLSRHHIALSDDLTVLSGVSPADGGDALRTLLGREPDLTTVFCGRDELAVGALNAALRMGMKVPERLSIIGHGDVPLVSAVEPALTSIRVNYDAIAAALIEQLFSLMDRPLSRPEPRAVRASLIDRESTGPCALAAACA